MQQLSLSLPEIIVLMAGAITLGITIHFFIVSRRSLKNYTLTPEKNTKSLEEWKLRYFNDMEKKDQELASQRIEAEHLQAKNLELSSEAEELRIRLKKITHSTRENSPSGIEPAGYLQQLKETQQGLMEQNQRIAELLEQIEVAKENEGLRDHYRQDNEELQARVEELKSRLAAKEKELEDARQKSQVSREMSSMLDNAYQEFNVLQEKILKLESQVSSSHRINMEYEDLREGFFKASKDLEEQRSRLAELLNENRDLQQELADSNDKLREANFQRQQLQKRVAYLEELNQDLQAVGEANRKLESQLKRIGELESLLHVMAEERDQLARNQMNASSL